MKRIADGWYKAGFGLLYPVVYAHRTVEAAEPEALFAARQVNLGPCDRVLDIGCGNGRHMVHLRRIASGTAGLDFSEDLLRAAAVLLGDGARLVRADMRHIPFGSDFDVIVNFFTTFGYFATSEQDLLMVREMARVLCPGGRWFIDFLNAACVRKTLAPETERRQDAYRIRERRWIDSGLDRVNKVIEVSRDGRTVGTWSESVRLYGEGEMRNLLEEGGLSVDAVFGDYDGGPMGEDAPRLILVGHRRR